MEEAIKLLLTYGPGGVIAALVVLGVLVPRSFYDREVKRGDLATEATVKTVSAMTDVTETLKTVVAENKTLLSEMGEVRQEVRGLREDLRILRSNGGPA